MTTILSGLTSLFKGRDPEQPEGLSPDFKVEIPEEEEADKEKSSEPYIDVDLAGNVYGVVYQTPMGAQSRRWVTVEGFKKNADGMWSMYAYCFVRKRVRSFPLDKIEALYDAEGEPLTLSEIFPQASGAAPKLADTSGHATIDACRDGLRALAALAKIDGTYHDKEHDTIMAFAAAASKKAGVTMGAADQEAVARYVKHLQPTGDLVAGCLERIAEEDNATQKEFFWAAREVMDADGLQEKPKLRCSWKSQML